MLSLHDQSNSMQNPDRWLSKLGGCYIIYLFCCSRKSFEWFGWILGGPGGPHVLSIVNGRRVPQLHSFAFFWLVTCLETRTMRLSFIQIYVEGLFIWDSCYLIYWKLEELRALEIAAAVKSSRNSSLAFKLILFILFNAIMKFAHFNFN